MEPAKFSLDRLRTVLSEQLGVDEDEFTLDAELRADLSADELDIVEIVMALEGEYGIEISDLTADTWITFGDIVKTIEQRMKK